MNFPDVVFEIIETDKCPHYKPGNEVKLSENALFVSDNRPTCVILFLDITEIILNIKEPETVLSENNFFSCSGCTGKIRLRYKKENRTVINNNDNVHAIANLLKGFSFFQILNDHDINDLIPLLTIKKFFKKEIIIKKGDPGKNLFIILSGKVDVLVDDMTHLGFMEKGEVFGEISILVGTPATATIRVTELVTVLMMDGGNFKRLLKKFPSLQMYFARLLAQRLAKTNIERLEELEAGIIGKLSEMPPSELLQTLNLNHKTGNLILNSSNGSARLIFKEGELVYAKYGNYEGQEAFFEILKEKKGRFKFTPGISSEDKKATVIGDFMWLLMEGLNRIDEQKHLE